MSSKKADKAKSKNKGKPTGKSNRSVRAKGTLAQRQTREAQIDERLSKLYPKAHCTLDYRNPLELLVATILAAQCTDARVNIVTKRLFKKYRTPKDYAQAEAEVFQRDIASVGFFRNKTKSAMGCGKILIERFGGEVPKTMEELLTLPGVGRKTANVILGNSFGIPGIVVDTHVGRLSRRLGLSGNTDPDKVERDLMPVVPQDRWTMFSHLLVFHGRNVCLARKPHCDECVLNDICPSAGKV